KTARNRSGPRLAEVAEAPRRHVEHAEREEASEVDRAAVGGGGHVEDGADDLAALEGGQRTAGGEVERSEERAPDAAEGGDRAAGEETTLRPRLDSEGADVVGAEVAGGTEDFVAGRLP